MKIAIIGDEPHKLAAILEAYRGMFERVEHGPEYVFAFGGDGTLMRAEQVFPGVPKMLIRNSRVAKLANKHSTEETIKAFFDGSFAVVEQTKLSVAVNGVVKAQGINDVVVHNENPRHAIRYSVSINGKMRHELVIGDGVVCATALGSTGYYRSITDSCFETGIGLAFNNSTEQTDHIVLGENSIIELSILRGPGFCYADNQEATFPLSEGDTVEIRKADDVARIIRIAIETS